MYSFFVGAPEVQVSLYEERNKIVKDVSPCHSKVCGDRIVGWDCGDNVADWLCDVLGMEGLRLLRQCSQDTYDTARLSRSGKHLHFCFLSPRISHISLNLGDNVPLSLTNKAQYLLINKTSVQWLLDAIPEDEFEGGIENLILRFRPNFVVNFREPLVENDFTEIIIDNTTFKVG